MQLMPELIEKKPYTEKWNTGVVRADNNKKSRLSAAPFFVET
jgi:hypothetical protein